MIEDRLPSHCLYAENIALALYKQFGEDIKFFKASKYFHLLLKSCDAEYIEYPFNQNIYGFVVSNEDGISLTINKNINKSMYNFTFAHELGHILLHVKNGQELPIDTIDSLKDSNKEKLEIEANQFAAHFLLPTKSLVSQIRSGYTALNIKNNSDVSLDTVKWRIINHLKRFNVNQEKAVEIYENYLKCTTHKSVMNSEIYKFLHSEANRNLEKMFDIYKNYK